MTLHVPDPPPKSRRWPFVKDVLVVGEHHVGGRAWRVERRTLDRLAANFASARRRGLRFPVVWDHSTSAKDQLGEVTQLRVRGDELVARGWLDRPAESLADKGCEVSVEVHEPFFDGRGRRYDMMLTHLAVVTHPVVAGLRPFAASPHPCAESPSFKFRGAVPMTESHASAVTEAPRDRDVAPSSFAGPRLTLELNRLLSAAGSNESLPDGETAAEILPMLYAILARLFGPSTPAANDGPESETRRLALELDAARTELEALRSERDRERRAAFFQALDRLVAEGRVAPADREAIASACESAGWRLSLLAPFERIPAGSAAPMKPVARRFARPDPPRPGDPEEPMSPDRASEIARRFRR